MILKTSIINMTENVEQIIDSLSKLYKILEKKQSQEHKNTQTFFEVKRQLSTICILPKKLLRKSFLFLDFIEEIPQILITCKLFNSIIKSRTFQVLLHTQASLRTAKIYNTSLLSNSNDMENVKLKPETEVNTKEDALAQLKIANAGRDFLANKLKKQDKKIEDLNKEILRLQEEIKLQKVIHSKGIEKMNTFEVLFENEKKNHVEGQKTLACLQQQYKNEIEGLKALILASERDKTDLEKQKMELKDQVIRLREDNAGIVKKINVYQHVLSKLKGYFEAMQDANLLKRLV